MRGHISMRKIREILRLKFMLNKSNRFIAKCMNTSRNTVKDCINKASLANIGWPIPDNLDDAVLEQKLYPTLQAVKNDNRRDLDWAKIHEELKRKSVTLMLLWNEYIELNPAGISYSNFCRGYSLWDNKLDAWMRQDYKAGEKMFVDYAGDTVLVMINNIEHNAQVFVAVLGASNYMYAEATLTQSMQDWTESHGRAFAFFGGVPELIVPDNLKSGIDFAHRYEPDANSTYQDLADHYGVAIMPARVRSPKDKTLAEKGVQHAQYQILAKIRNRKYFSLLELNQDIRNENTRINSQPFQKLPGSRLSQYEKLEKPVLRPLPAAPYKYAQWAKATLGYDYHIEVDRHLYSVPYTLIRKKIVIRFAANVVEIFYRSKRVASHVRKYTPGRTSLVEHMPKSHQEHASWDYEKIIDCAQKIGPATLRLLEKIMATKPHKQIAIRACLGIIRLGKSYTDVRVEAACTRALKYETYSCKRIETILKNNLEYAPADELEALMTTKEDHENVRGGDYYE